jgi:hypothetical protein
MKNLIKITTVLFLLVQVNGYSQTTLENNTKEQETVEKKDKEIALIDTKNLKKFIGTYELTEANFTFEIVQEEDKMYIITEFSKDQLLLKDENTLCEFTRGVDLQLIEGNKNALKFSQNGYEATLKRVKSKDIK